VRVSGIRRKAWTTSLVIRFRYYHAFRALFRQVCIDKSMTASLVYLSSCLSILSADSSSSFFEVAAMLSNRGKQTCWAYSPSFWASLSSAEVANFVSSNVWPCVSPCSRILALLSASWFRVSNLNLGPRRQARTTSLDLRFWTHHTFRTLLHQLFLTSINNKYNLTSFDSPLLLSPQ